MTFFQYPHLCFVFAGTYRDVHFANSSPLREAKEVRSAYCLHVLNHVLKANTRVLRNNVKLKETKDVNVEFRDQGITRPKVQIHTTAVFLLFVCFVCFNGI